MWSEFKKFAVRGNVLDMAVGIIIGAAFTSVVRSLVDDIIMPPIGRFTGGADFSDLFITLGDGEYASLIEAREAGAATINYGVFINNVLAFLIVATVVFFIVRAYNRLQQREEGPPPPPTDRQCPFCMLLVPVSATRCGHCTSEIAEAA